MPNKRSRLVSVLGQVITLSFCWLASAFGQSGPDAALARELLQKAELRAGLVLHLGCGQKDTPGLTAALAESPSIFVHGLALDDAACARARKAIEAAGVTGRAMVECVPLNSLPYLSDLANLVVVEDPAALTKLGVTRKELLRVLAPRGSLLIHERGMLTGKKWTRTVKPRPKAMDDWTHPQHGPDMNMVSSDRLVKFPLGFRWLDGLPVNVNRWAACRGWIVANGRVFTLSSTELDNLRPNQPKTHYLAARDAWNGLPLWRINCETTDDGSYLTWQNAGPLVADDRRVYVVKKDKTIAVDAATGDIAFTCPNRYAPVRLLLLDGILVASCWESRDFSRAPFDRFDKEKDTASLWATWIPKASVGSVEAYEAANGKPKWSLPLAAQAMLAADGVVYLMVQGGNPPTERHVVAVDLKTGKERWRVAHTQFGPEADFQLSGAGAGYVVVARRIAGEMLVLSATDGHVLWKLATKGFWAPVVDGLLWHGGKKYDPLTGEAKGSIPVGISGQSCTPSVIVNNIITQSRGCGYVEWPPSDAPADAKPKSVKYTGARGACMQGMVPANGMFYTAQNWCRCAPGQVYGFVALGPSGEWPKAEDFEKPRPVEKGPAFGNVHESTPAPGDWPMFRGNPQRSSFTPLALPGELRELWKVQVASPPGEGNVADAWKCRLASCVSAPVVAQGMAFVAKTDAGQVAALDAATGKPVWCASLGSRIDSAPTVARGLCLVGCHDGYLYALHAMDGQLAWRVRVAPWERRMVAFGMVESVWPAVGSALVHDGVLYAHAGRTTESDGGVAVVALDAATGQHVWAKGIAPGPLRQNDILRVADGAVAFHHLKLNPKTGEGDLSVPATKTDPPSGLWDGTWTVMGKRRSGDWFKLGKVTASLLAWNDTLAVTHALAISRQKALTAEELKPADYTWTVSWPKGAQIEALALTANAAVYAGRHTQPEDPAAPGFLRVVSAADGKALADFPLPAPPTYDGLAVANDRICISLQNGSLVCYGR